MKEQVILSILSKAVRIMPTQAAQELRRILEAELLPYEITVACTALVPYQGAHSQLRMYLASKQLEGLSMLTLERYDAHLQKFITAMQMPVEDITTMHIRAYLAAYQSSGVMLSTLNTLQSCLKSFFFLARSGRPDNQISHAEDPPNKNTIQKTKTFEPNPNGTAPDGLSGPAGPRYPGNLLQHWVPCIRIAEGQLPADQFC